MRQLRVCMRVDSDRLHGLTRWLATNLPNALGIQFHLGLPRPILCDSRGEAMAEKEVI